MLRKIYQELKAIRRELQEIKEILKPKHVDIYIGGVKIDQATTERRRQGGGKEYEQAGYQ